jgi:hypothetical protein
MRGATAHFLSGANKMKIMYEMAPDPRHYHAENIEGYRRPPSNDGDKFRCPRCDFGDKPSSVRTNKCDWWQGCLHCAKCIRQIKKNLKLMPLSRTEKALLKDIQKNKFSMVLTMRQMHAMQRLEYRGLVERAPNVIVLKAIKYAQSRHLKGLKNARPCKGACK